MASKPHFDGKENEVEVLEEWKKFFFPPRAFNIVWGNDSRYWRIPQQPGDKSPAELVQVSWLEVTTSKILPAGKYSIGFMISLNQGATGWDNYPVFLMAKVGKRGRYSWKRVKLSSLAPEAEPTRIPQNDKFEIDVPSNNDQKIFFGIYEVWSGKWKTGLKIHGAHVEKVN
ncbi:hypothetical protein ACFE04_015888 [Oxalis oulophora]